MLDKIRLLRYYIGNTEFHQLNEKNVSHEEQKIVCVTRCPLNVDQYQKNHKYRSRHNLERATTRRSIRINSTSRRERTVLIHNLDLIEFQQE